MNWFKNLLKPIAEVPSPNQWIKPCEEDKVLELIRDYLDSHGGLARVVEAFEQSGFISKVRSWVSSGPNQPINSVEALQLLGWPSVLEMAKKADLSADHLRDLLAKLLPVAIDRATPEGKL